MTIFVATLAALKTFLTSRFLVKFPEMESLYRLTAQPQLTKSLAYGQHTAHEDKVREMSKGDVRRCKVQIFDKVAASGIKGLRLFPLEAVVTNRDRINSAYASNPSDNTLAVSPCLCVGALPLFLK